MVTGIAGLPPQANYLAAAKPRFHHWQGASGRWWITTVYPLLASHIDLPAVYLMVRRDVNGLAHPLYIGQTSNTARRMNEHQSDKIWQATVLGGSELHLHFRAEREWERFAIETDLRNGHHAPLNRQDTAVASGLFGLLGS